MDLFHLFPQNFAGMPTVLELESARFYVVKIRHFRSRVANNMHLLRSDGGGGRRNTEKIL